jgi:hypothetical protein
MNRKFLLFISFIILFIAVDNIFPHSFNKSRLIKFDYSLVNNDSLQKTILFEKRKGIGDFQLDQNYPNPSNPTTTISYEIAKQGLVKLSVYNILGKEVATLVDEVQSPGKYEVEFDGSDLSSGIYFYKLIADNFISTKKLTLLK